MSEVEVAPQRIEHEIALQSVAAQFGEALGREFLTSHIEKGDLWVRVSAGGWHNAIAKAQSFGFSYFCFLSAIDWMPNPSLSGEKVFEMEAVVDVDDAEEDEAVEEAAEEDTTAEDSTAMTSGYAGGDTRFQVFARLYDIQRHFGITLKVDVLEPALELASVVDVFAGADWHEREAWEMYGINFMGHPGLRHLYLPTEFEGHPLRKDFPLLAREVKPWPGIVDVEPIPPSLLNVEASAGES